MAVLELFTGLGMNKLSIQDGLEALDSFLTINGHVLNKVKSNTPTPKSRVEVGCKTCTSEWLYDFYPADNLVNLSFLAPYACGKDAENWKDVIKLASQFSEIYEGQWQ